MATILKDEVRSIGRLILNTAQDLETCDVQAIIKKIRAVSPWIDVTPDTVDFYLEHPEKADETFQSGS